MGPIVFVALAGAVLAGSGQAAQPTAQQPPATAAISGTVTDGVTGRPLGAVIVALRAPSTGAPLARFVRVVTDDQGRFVMRDLPAGEGYSITTTRVGYVEGAYGQQTMFGVAGRINLKDGEWFPRANIVMWRPGAISGTLRDEANEPVVGAYVRVLARHIFGGQPQLLAGPVARTDDRGEYRIAGLGPGQYVVHVPSIQAAVPVDAPAGLLGASGDTVRTQNSMSFLVPPRTDAVLDPVGASQQVIGNFMTPPPPATRGRANAYAMTFYPGVDKAELASPIDLALGEERTGIDLTIRPVPSVSVSGTVAGPAEAISGLVLRLIPTGLEGLSDGAEAAIVLVGADRTFTFFNVPAGDYVIDAPGTSLELTYTGGVDGRLLPQSPGLRWGGLQSGSLESGPPGTGYVRKSGSRTDRFWTRTLVPVGEADITNLVVTMTPSFVLNGWLVYEGTTRTTFETTPITTATGGVRPATTTATTEVTPRPLTQPTIELEPAAGNPGLGIPRSERPEDGSPQDFFTIGGLKPGEYVLRITLGGSRFTVKSITIDGVDYTTKPIDASILGPRSEAVVTLTDKLTSVRGSVRDSRGPVSNAAVLVFPADRTMWSRYGLRPARLRAAPLSGSPSFVIDGLPAGDYLVVAVAANQLSAWQDPKFLERAAAVATRFTLQWGETRSLDLSLGAIK